MTVNGAIWRDQLTAEERSVLGRADDGVAGARPDVLVIGGGILGVTTAAACAEAGLGSVLLIETGRLGAGATGGATGLLIPEPHQWSDPEPFVDLERAGLERWRDLQQSVPGGVGLVEVDWLGLAPHDSGYAAHQPRAVEWLNPGQVGELLPGLARPMEGALIHRQGRINPLRAVARLAARLPAVTTGVAATSVEINGDRIVRVATSAALATQIENGQLLAGGTFDPGDESPAVQPEVIDAIVQGLAAVLPALRGIGVAYQWCCFRPRHPDRRPVIDMVPGLANAWLTSGHFRTGILNAPVTAAVLSRWIAAGEPPVEAGTWSATRFAGH